MAHGLPDYNRGVDVAYQALSQMIVRPKYGGAVRTSGGLVVTASVETLLCTVSGKGMIYGGWIRLDHTSTQKDSGVIMAVDGDDIFSMSFDGGIKYGITYPRCSPMILQLFDDVNFIYSVGISYGITFETEVKLSYQEEHVQTPSVGYNLVYALI